MVDCSRCQYVKCCQCPYFEMCKIRDEFNCASSTVYNNTNNNSESKHSCESVERKYNYKDPFCWSKY